MEDECDLMSRSGLNFCLTLGINAATSVCKFMPVLCRKTCGQVYRNGKASMLVSKISRLYPDKNQSPLV